MAITAVQHIISRCGGGKSWHTVREIHERLKSMDDHGLILFASKTNALSAQNHARFEDVNATSEIKVESMRVDSTVTSGIRNILNEFCCGGGFKGVLFVSHDALTLMHPESFKDVMVFTDEVPQRLVQHLSVSFNADDSSSQWESYLETSPSKHKSYQRVTIREDLDHDVVRSFAIDILEKRSTKYTSNVAEILLFLLQDYEVLYTTITDTDGVVRRVYSAIHWGCLQSIVDNALSLTILAAQLEQTQLGYFMTELLGLEINVADIGIELEEKHKHKVRIVPYLKTGKWSTTSKRRPVKEVINVTGSNLTVAEHIQEFSLQVMGDNNFIVTTSNKDRLLPEIEDAVKLGNVVRTSSAVHGMNHLRHFKHAAYIASNRPTPFELKALRRLCIDYGLDSDKLIKATLTERCYEAAYQSLARTSIRNAYDVDDSTEHVLIVPDMEYAEYLSSWFEEGCATIDTTMSYEMVTAQKREDAYYNRRAVVVAIISDKQSGKGKIKDLVHSYGIAPQTYKRYRKEHLEHLVSLGLVKGK